MNFSEDKIILMVKNFINELIELKESYYKTFDDFLPMLKELSNLSYPMIVISNWDNKLSEILKNQNLSNYFNTTVVSSIIGHEKPKPEIYCAALKAINNKYPNIKPNEILHIGDIKRDDYDTPIELGFHAVWFDKNEKYPDNKTVINSLMDISEVIKYINNKEN